VAGGGAEFLFGGVDGCLGTWLVMGTWERSWVGLGEGGEEEGVRTFVEVVAVVGGGCSSWCSSRGSGRGSSRRRVGGGRSSGGRSSGVRHVCCVSFVVVV
jgi:hypothetical protein